MKLDITPEGLSEAISRYLGRPFSVEGAREVMRNLIVIPSRDGGDEEDLEDSKEAHAAQASEPSLVVA